MKGIPEEVLRRIWETRITSTTLLTSSDGLPITVLDRGTPNHDAGPDFLNALIRIGIYTFRGDIEIHGTPEEWYAHGHHTDPHYNRVVLHVVAGCPAKGDPARTSAHRILPLLILDRNISDLYKYLDSHSLSGHSLLKRGLTHPHRDECFSVIASRLRRSRNPRALLRRKGWTRLLTRMRRFELRVHQLLAEERGMLAEPLVEYEGNPDDIPLPHPSLTQQELNVEWIWDEVLYEGIMEALGYSRNTEAFLALARNIPLATLRRRRLDDTRTMMALLFGCAGLLPPLRDIPDRESRRYVRSLRRKWKSLQRSIRVPRLHEADWLFFRLRPANFPTARLAAFTFLLPGMFADGGFRRLKALVSNADRAPRRRLRHLRRLFWCPTDNYWQHHLHFRGRLSPFGASLGKARVDAILLNCVLPLVMLSALLERDERAERQSRRLLTALPSGHETRMLERIRRFLLPEGRKRLSALEQQGAIAMWVETEKGRRKDRSVSPLASQLYSTY